MTPNPFDTLYHILNGWAIDPYQESPIFIDATRNDLAALFNDLHFSHGVEIGVKRGGYSEVLLKAIPGLHLGCIDPWEAYDGYQETIPQDYHNRLYERTKIKLSAYPGCEVIRKFSSDAVKTWPDDVLEFVYIDGNHDLGHVLHDVMEWSAKVVPGGIVAGHDFSSRTFKDDYKCEVEVAIRRYAKHIKVLPWFVLTGDGLDPTWFWVKG
jgi:hypothetical protein